MRIIAGKHRSRRLLTLSDSEITRPTLDQVKESLFNAIGPFFNGGNLCDLFGGSGAIALEFVSRGISYAAIVEKNYKAAHIIKENIKALHEEEKIELYIMDAFQFLKQSNRTFDYIYLDPPFNFIQYDKLLTSLIKICHPQTQIFLETAPDFVLPIMDGISLKRHFTYRSCQIFWLIIH